MRLLLLDLPSSEEESNDMWKAPTNAFRMNSLLCPFLGTVLMLHTELNIKDKGQAKCPVKGLYTKWFISVSVIKLSWQNFCLAVKITQLWMISIHFLYSLWWRLWGPVVWGMTLILVSMRPDSLCLLWQAGLGLGPGVLLWEGHITLKGDGEAERGLGTFTPSARTCKESKAWGI